ncbi:MAG: ANTAR domain-containing protein, partial [Actinobacteria bacterium]|nr:ANTAR domain-containing protein [Actinomycetota bacterium]
MTASSSSDVSRLTSLVERQRRELDRMRAQAAARSVIDTAQGVLMERLGCPPGEAARQLAKLAEESGTSVAELAADITGERLAQVTGQAADGDQSWSRLGLAGAAVAAAADGDELAAATLDQALAPAGAGALALWLLEPDGSLELAGQAGLGMGEAGRWRHLPFQLDCLPQRVARAGTEVLWPSG